MDEFAFLHGGGTGGGTSADIMSMLRTMDPVSTATGTASSLLASLGMGPAAGAGGEGAGAAAPSEPSPEELLLGPGPAAAAAPPAGAPGAAPEADKAVDDLEKRFPFMKQSGVVPKIQNVVAMFSLGTRLDLKHIGLHAKNAEYNPKRFAAVIMRIREPKTTALIFESGKVVVTGASDEDASKRASKRFAKIIVKLGYEAKFKDFKVQNIVGSTGVNFPIRLELMAADNAMFSSYEPELFPGLIFRMENPKVVLLIFVSGKIVLTGARSRDDVYAAFNRIYPVLMKYDRNKSTKPPPLPPAPVPVARQQGQK